MALGGVDRPHAERDDIRGVRGGADHHGGHGVGPQGTGPGVAGVKPPRVKPLMKQGNTPIKRTWTGRGDFP